MIKLVDTPVMHKKHEWDSFELVDHYHMHKVSFHLPFISCFLSGHKIMILLAIYASCPCIWQFNVVEIFGCDDSMIPYIGL